MILSFQTVSGGSMECRQESMAVENLSPQIALSQTEKKYGNNL